MVTKKPKGLGLGLEALLGPKVNDNPAPTNDGAPRTLVPIGSMRRRFGGGLANPLVPGRTA